MPKIVNRLYEYDKVYNKVLKQVGSFSDSDFIDAQDKAREMSKSWCEDEEPKSEIIGDGFEVWSGNSDYGIIIIRMVIYP